MNWMQLRRRRIDDPGGRPAGLPGARGRISRSAWPGWCTERLRIGSAFACMALALLLWIPANLLPFLTTSIAGISRRSLMSSSLAAMSQDGFPELGAVVLLVSVLVPFAHFALSAAVLGSLATGHRPRWLGRAFRSAEAIRPWAMTDVFLLGLLVAWARLRVTVSVEVGAGATCFVAAALLALLGSALIDDSAVRRAIDDPGPAPSNAPRKPHALGNSAALTLAALLLYVPANLYPMATLPIGFTAVSYNIAQGVIDLIDARLYALALLVFVASFLIPVLKLAVLAWCLFSVLRRSRRHLRAKTVALHWVDRFGRWSMVDPLVIACFVPAARYNALLHASAGAAAPMFCAVVILTMCATRSFDPRLLREREVSP